MTLVKQVLTVGATLAFTTIIGATRPLWSAEPRPAEPAQAAIQPAGPAGLYVTRMADCMACHTKPGGTAFAGGRMISTPFGTLSTPNITPDPDTGIGRWTDDQFYRVLHDGIGHAGEFIYPVMPFTSYTKMTRQDVQAVRTYLGSLKPVYAPRAPSTMAFPFDIRDTLLVWRELYFTAHTYSPDAQRPADWNRGAYLVEGPGHCGECHSPRNVMGAVEPGHSLAGGMAGRWLAPNISADPRWGIGAWPVAQIVSFMRTGASHPEGVAFGPMHMVVHDSLRFATDADLTDIATFLKSGPDRDAPASVALVGAAGSPAGQALYLNTCANCHQDHGVGLPGVVPNLAGNASILSSQPTDIVLAVLNGLHGSGGYAVMPSFAGALSDRQVADVANYI